MPIHSVGHTFENQSPKCQRRNKAIGSPKLHLCLLLSYVYIKMLRFVFLVCLSELFEELASRRNMKIGM